jgi:hypothetical protein
MFPATLQADAGSVSVCELIIEMYLKMKVEGLVCEIIAGMPKHSQKQVVKRMYLHVLLISLPKKFLIVRIYCAALMVDDESRKSVGMQ